MKKYKRIALFLLVLLLITGNLIFIHPIFAAYHFSSFKGRPPIHFYQSKSKIPKGLMPDDVKKLYNLAKTGGNGTIAIIGAYDDSQIEKDLNTFSKTFGLAECTTSNGCFEKHQMAGGEKANSGWSYETSLDVEWAHAIAPNARVLLVEAITPSGPNLLSAVDYARNRPDVVSVSMSWGGAEFPDETSLDSHFISTNGVTFFAASGDNGSGASWPAASPNVVSVGGTSFGTIQIAKSLNSSSIKETAWAGSGGGVSVFEKEPDYQKNYSIKKANGMRSIPDVSFNADPHSGYSIYRSAPSGAGGWYTVGGTSAATPIWAAIKSLGLSADNQKFYADKSVNDNEKYFRDVVSGSNGSCAYYCSARARYDYITGLGSPLTVHF